MNQSLNLLEKKQHERISEKIVSLPLYLLPQKARLNRTKAISLAYNSGLRSLFKKLKRTLKTIFGAFGFDFYIIRKNPVIVMKKILKQTCPPFLWSTLKKLRPRYGFFGVYSKFPEVTFGDPWTSLGWTFGQKKKLLNVGSENKQSFFPLPHLTEYNVILCFLVNLLSQKKPIRVLDHYGGTGYIYHAMHPYLQFPENVEWSVLDSPTLLRKGKDFLNQCINSGGKVNFISDLPNPSSENFDVVYVNTSVQYYPDYQKTIGDLLTFKPKYFIFTRLLSGEGKTFVCMQKVSDKKIPCRFINSLEFVEYFKEKGYDLILKVPNKEELLGKRSVDFREFKDIPKEYQIPFSINLVFEKMV